MARRAAVRSVDRTMRLTGPTPPAGADRRWKPSVSRAKASSGRPASSPHTETGVPVSTHFRWISASARSAGGDKGSYRSDTVGFVRNLPHQLVEAFRSTLEEATFADVLMHVVDAAHPDPHGQLAAVREVLAEADTDDIAELIVFNKSDLADPDVLTGLLARYPEAVAVSAATGDGIDELRERLAGLLPTPDHEVTVLLPYDRGDLVSRIHDEGTVLVEKRLPEGTAVQAKVDADLLAALEEFRKPDMFAGQEHLPADPNTEAESEAGAQAAAGHRT